MSIVPEVSSAAARRLPEPSTSTGHRWGAFCQLYVVALAGLAILVASQIRRFLPDRFLLDGRYIEQTLQMPDGILQPGDPFRGIALVYRYLGLAHAPNAAAMVALLVFTIGVFSALRWEELARLTPFGLGVVSVSYLLALIYLAQYSKEFVSLGIAVLVLLLPRTRWAELLIVLAMLAYAANMRPYWAIVAGLYVAGRLLLPRVRGLLPVAALVFAFYVALQIGFNTVLGESLSYPRVSVNQVRADVNDSVGSLIVDVLPDTVLLQSPDAFVMFLSLIAPWPLVLGGSVTYLVMAGVLVVLWGLVAVSIRRLQRERAARSGRRDDTGRYLSAPLAERSPRPERAVALLLALVVVQAIFEPDYGSYVKHLSPVLPLFLTLLPLRRKESVR